MYASYFIASKNKKIARKCLHRCVTASQRTNQTLTKKCASCVIHCKECVSLWSCFASCAIVCKKHNKTWEVSQCHVYGLYTEHRHVRSLYRDYIGGRRKRIVPYWMMTLIRQNPCTVMHVYVHHDHYRKKTLGMWSGIFDSQHSQNNIASMPIVIVENLVCRVAHSSLVCAWST